MRNLKTILPMLAFVLAIGMSFAFSNAAEDDLVIEVNGQLYESPFDCQGQGTNCTVTVSIDGKEHKIQVMRETASGDYVPETTTQEDNTVYPLSSLIPITP